LQEFGQDTLQLLLPIAAVNPSQRQAFAGALSVAIAIICLLIAITIVISFFLQQEPSQ